MRNYIEIFKNDFGKISNAPQNPTQKFCISECTFQSFRVNICEENFWSKETENAEE